MTLTASLPTKALASVLAALLLSAALAAAVPTRAELPSVLSAFDVASAEAHTQQSCRTETLPVQNRHGTATNRTYTRTVCVEVPHDHWYRALHMGGAAGLSCAAVGLAATPVVSLGAGLACGIGGAALGLAS